MAQKHTLLQKFSLVCVVLGYFIYPGANTVFFQTFNCVQIDSVSYLQNDLSIQCDDPSHRTASNVAGLMVVIFSVGLPLTYLLLLLPHRNGFAAQSGRSQIALEQVHMLRFFYLDYKPGFFYWEILECLRKLLLTGVAVLVAPGALMQVVAALFVVMAYIGGVAMCKPYREKRHNHLALTLYTMIAVTLLCGLLLKVKDGYTSQGKYADGFDLNSLTGVLLGSVFTVLGVGVGMAVFDGRRVIREPLLRFKEGHQTVELPPLGDYSFDLFLSHSQDLGQDQVATIKAALERLLPSIRIFLDVESLDDLHALDDLVKSSRAVLIFLTTGCLRRFFVRLEVKAAMDNATRMILVQETDDRHGKCAITEHRKDCAIDVGSALFDSAHEPILWFRAAHFKQISIKQIVQRMIADTDQLPELFLPGEIALRDVELPPAGEYHATKHHFWLPDCAPWCTLLETSLLASLPGLLIHRATPGTFQHHTRTADGSTDGQREATIIKAWHALIAHKGQLAVPQLTHAVLIPLNKDTLQDKGVQSDILSAIRANVLLVLLHIQEEDFGHCPFGTFFEQCPSNLQDAGLFDELACMWYFRGPAHVVSCKSVGLKLAKAKASATLSPTDHSQSQTIKRQAIVGDATPPSKKRSVRVPVVVIHPTTDGCEYTTLLTEVYQKHDPEKLTNPEFVRNTLARYSGREDELIAALRKKYQMAAAALAVASQSQAATSTPDYITLVTEIYQQHNPEKLKSDPTFVVSTLSRYAGREDELLAALRKKYNDML